MPHAWRQRDALYRGGQNPAARFVHYTSAEAAVKILTTKRVWLRNTTCMSDYREVQHGYEMLLKFLADPPSRANFCETLDSITPGAATEAVDLFDRWWSNIRFSTYIASISEHDDKEDVHGRLSMWRAFGNSPARVAIVFRVPWFIGAASDLDVIFSPVAYLPEVEVRALIADVQHNVTREQDFLKGVDRQTLVATIFNMLVAGVTCLKHEGFHEEREWRVIYAPDRSRSLLIESSMETIGGIPQIVYQLPLDRRKSQTLASLDLATMFDRLIIGPSQFPRAMYEAFSKVLTELGVDDAQGRIFISGIPIRS